MGVSYCRDRLHEVAPLNRGSLNSAHIRGTHVPVEEPSTASKTEVTYSIISSARASEPLINTVWPSGPHRGIAQIWLGENVAPGSGLAVATTAALAGAFVALDPQAVQSWG